MKELNKRLKAIALFLSGLILLQGCVVYHKTPTTLEQASQEQVKTKITTAKKSIRHYKYIDFEGDTFYGVKKKSGDFIKTPLNEEEISQVFTENEKASKWATVAAIGIPTLFFGILIIVGLNNSNIIGGTWGGI